MKINQLIYINSAFRLSCRGDESLLSYGDELCLAGRPVPAAQFWQKMVSDGEIEFPDCTGRRDGFCKLTQRSFTNRKAVYELQRRDGSSTEKIAVITIEQYPRPTSIGNHKVRGRIEVSDTIALKDADAALRLAGALETAAQIALSFGVIRLVCDDTPPQNTDDAACLRAELAQLKATSQAMQDAYDGYVQTIEQSLREWETRCPQEDTEKRAFPLPDDYTSRLEKALSGLHICVAGGSDLWHEKFRSRFPGAIILENRNFDIQKLQGADVLIINTNHTSHALVRKACQQAAAQGTLVCYTSRYNLNAVAADILYALGGA